MKKISVILSIVMLGGLSACEQDDVPQEVKQALAEKYPQASEAEWEKEDGNHWEADFEMNGTEMSATFDANGMWLESEWEVEGDDVPAAVMAAVTQDFAGYEVEEVDRIEMSNGEVAYEVELEKGDEEWEVIFSADGQVIRKQMSDEDDAKDKM